MTKFAKNIDPKAIAKTQSANVMKQIQGVHLKSVGTVRNYEQALFHVALYANQYFNCGLRTITTEQALTYLTVRAKDINQSSLNMERQAIQCMMRHVSKSLALDKTLPVIPSEKSHLLDSRTYTQDQVNLIAQHQSPHNALATQIAYTAGLRAHELLTLNHPDKQPPHERETHQYKFSLQNGVIYTVNGKGGLIREVMIPTHLAQQLEQCRLSTPTAITDRGIYYLNNYNIGGGKAWSNSFSKTSKHQLFWTRGGHGLRHSYAQKRMETLQGITSKEIALKVVSLELGHFRPEITEVYLR